MTSEGNGCPQKFSAVILPLIPVQVCECVCVHVCSKLTGAGGGRQPHPPEMMCVTGGGD